MQEIQYVGEYLIPGRMGHLFVILGFISAILAAYSFFQASKEDSNSASWKKIARYSFVIHGICIFSIIITIFYLMTTHHYEYQYVWAHVNDELPKKYILSAFWEGQEGSFLLWMFWHVILGFILIKTSGKWENAVMGILSLVQLFIVSMLLGLYFYFGTKGFKLGSNPFELLRETMDAPIFKNPNYIKLIKGKGLNPLLQNYWMTIHPPTLFLGFASTVVPFCFAMAGMIRKEYTAWFKPVLPWALFSAAILGLGVLMGGAWAYEALSFGGYWAWDPVENMSLVPWLIMIAAIHSNLVTNATGYSAKASFILYLLSFILVLYSTFLTRSGILGDTSVHAFTEMGLEWQLVIFISFFIILSLYYFIKSNKNIIAPAKEEKIESKEFWIFIGTLVLVFSSVLITFTTSIPVFNKLFDAVGSIIHQDFTKWHRTAPTDAVAHYNKYQLWIAVFIGILAGGSQFLRYNEFNWKSHGKKFIISISLALLASAVFTFLTTLWIKLFSWQYYILLVAGYFALFSNIIYFFNFIKRNLRIAGSVFSHIGFGLLIIGVIASGLNKRHISENKFAMDGILNEKDAGKNVVLIKNLPMFMNDYKVTYKGDSSYNHTREFFINYARLNKEGKTVESFDIKPYILYTQDFSKLASTNPSTKRYLQKDIFSVVSNLPKEEVEQEASKAKEDSLKYKLFQLSMTDSIVTDKNIIKVVKVIKNPNLKHFKLEKTDIPLGLELSVYNKKLDTTFTTSPSIVLRDNTVYEFPDVVNECGLKIKLKEDIMGTLFLDEKGMQFEKFSFKRGDSINYHGINVKFIDFNKNVKHPLYFPEKGDIAVSALLTVSDNKNTYHVEPVYLIRDNAPFNIKDAVHELGLHFKFSAIDPEKETVSLEIAKSSAKDGKFGIEVADNYERSDFIVLEAIVFPGINLVWGGGLLMMFGLAFSSIRRYRDNKKFAA